MLANPAKLYPDTFGNTSLFLRFPYLLPNLVTAAFAFTALLLVFLYLPETMEDSHSQSAKEKPVKRGATVMELVRTPGVAPALCSYFLLSFIDLSFNEIVPLWAMSTQTVGGLAMEQMQIGWLMTFTGVLLVVYTFVLYARIVNFLGRVRSYRIGQMVFIPFCLGLTVLSQLPSDSAITFPLLIVMYAIGKACCSLGNSSLGLIMNRSVAKEQRASVNGLSMSVGSASKAVGPMSSAFIFAWSIADDQRPFPFDYHCVYVMLSLLAAICTILPLHYNEDDHVDNQSKESNGERGTGDEESAGYVEVTYQSDDEVEMKSMLEAASHSRHDDSAPLLNIGNGVKTSQYGAL